MRPSVVMMKAVEEPPSVTWPSSTIQASATPASAAACLASTWARSAVDLMSRRSQRWSGTVMTLTPVFAAGASRIAFSCVNITTVGAVASLGKANSRSWVPRVTCM